MTAIELTEQEWAQVMAILATAPWRDANPLLMKIGEQLRLKHMPANLNPGSQPEGNGKENRHVE